MQDFKSYTLDRRPARGQLIKRLVLSVIFLLILAAGFLFLISNPTEESQPANSANPDAESQPDQQRKLILPLSLPGQSQQRDENPAPTEQNSKGFLSQAFAADPVQTAQAEITPEAVPVPQAAAQPAAIEESRKTVYEIRSGDSMASIFKKNKLSPSLLHQIVNSSKTAKQLTDIRPGETLHMAFDSDDNLLSLRLEHSKVDSLEILATADGFTATEKSRAVDTRNTHLSGVIENSLYVSAKKSGLSDQLIMQLADIFGWDIDFALEIRSGDRFTVIFEEDYLDGEKLRDGPILAAEFINQGKTYQALRYVDDTGRADYYTPEGRSMRKAFLRAPVDFRRISSRFTRERYHPVLGKKRPHRGVDYAAKTGTPIKASGDGKVIFRGKKGGYGKTVIIQHGQTYTTLYAHLSRYNKKSRKGTRVKQGQVIGYVGKTGLATGPHLHYEFRVNGVHRNPLTVKLPAAKPIAKKYRDDFMIKIQPFISKLELIGRTLVADAQ
ncbi:MAG: peptidoglycan DD-metalloendopeptidase family protein [Candidatus Thiodiazotropha taylori]|nr:peptidoglycan DD-metalloendopeptidase family protein [Candidatus Thiodiazotropha taylori]MCW4276693.1 peptidoglycan DD-metalloendopeptidase family protein [Candidatus Thiodiazotropha taylori]